MRKIFISFISGWYIVITIINLINEISWRLLIHDILGGLIHNKSYVLNVLLPITFIIFFAFIIFALLNSGVVFAIIRIGCKEYKVGFPQKFKKHINKICASCFVIAVALLIGVLFPIIRRSTMEWKGSLTVAHAGGAVDGITYTNSLEALESNYRKGHRTFEIDMILTSDNELVCRHDWDRAFQTGDIEGEALDKETFLRAPIYDQYTPMSFADLCKIMDQYSDIYVVTDSKYSDVDSVREEFTYMVKTAYNIGLEKVLDRIIVQIYNEEMYNVIKDVYPFQSWIFTLYQIWDGNPSQFTEFSRFCYNHDIKNITMWNSRVYPEVLQVAREYNIHVYAHTENDVSAAKELLEQGIKGIYTDSITPNELRGENEK